MNKSVWECAWENDWLVFLPVEHQSSVNWLRISHRLTRDCFRIDVRLLGVGLSLTRWAA